MPKIYSARWVLPIISPAIYDGAIAVDDSKIVSVGPRAEVVAAFPHAEEEDFGNAAILPGFVNTHSHLELTVLRGFLEREEHDFFAWLKKLTIARLKMTDEDLFVSAACGAFEAARAGITCLGDSSSFALQSMRAINEVGLRATVYQESFGPDPKLAGENVGKLRAQLDAMRAIETELVRAGVSPHAPYTVSAPQLELISRLAIDEKLPVMMHAAESQAEKEFMHHGKGPFTDGLRLRNIEWHPPGVSTVRYLGDCGVMDTKPLLAHCINVEDEDLDLIEKARAGIAHCPKSNAKLGHGRARFSDFVARGIKVGLGSDSVASNNLCDILEEARFATLLSRLPVDRNSRVSNVSSLDERASADGPANTPVSAEQALFAATLGGACALGIDARIGALREGMEADIAIVNLSQPHQQPIHDPNDALIFSSSGRDVLLTVVAGREVYRDGRIKTTGEDHFYSQMKEIAVRLNGAA